MYILGCFMKTLFTQQLNTLLFTESIYCLVKLGEGIKECIYSTVVCK